MLYHHFSNFHANTQSVWPLLAHGRGNIATPVLGERDASASSNGHLMPVHGNKQFKKTAISMVIAGALIGSMNMPEIASAAALLQGKVFVDEAPIATEPKMGTGDSLYESETRIILRPLNSSGLSTFSTPVINSQYTVFLADGDYKVWQHIDSSLLMPTQISSLQWANESDALFITVSGSNITWTGTTSFSPISGGVVDFPFLDFSDPVLLNDMISITSACDINNSTDRIIICETGITSLGGLPCDSNIATGTLLVQSDITKRVFTSGNIRIKDLQAKSLCNYGDLFSTDNEDIKIVFDTVLMNDGSIKAEDAPTINSTSSLLFDGSSIYIKPITNEGGILANNGTIKAGNAATYQIDSGWASTFEHSLSKGGAINIQGVGQTLQYGILSAGQSSEIQFFDSGAAWDWEHHAGNAINDDMDPTTNLTTPSHGTNSSPGGGAGNTVVSGAIFTVGGESTTSGGVGGNIVIVNNDDCTNNPQLMPGKCINEIEGGNGGNLHLLTSSVIANNGSSISPGSFTALSGNSVYVEPDSTELSGNTTITAEKEIVIFGGDDHVIKMMNLADNAITAGGKIVIAVGSGGSIDLRGISNQVFKAGDKVEIHTDNLLLDSGVSIEDLVDAPNGVTVSGAKIIFHATITGTSQITTEAGQTVNAELTLRNAGPTTDTYTLTATNSDGITISGLPATQTIDGLQSAPLNLALALPAQFNAESTLVTVTATSQADPTVNASFEVRITTPQVLPQGSCASYDTQTNTVMLQHIDVPILSPFTGQPTGEVAVFEAKLQQIPGVSDFQLLPDSLKYQSMASDINPDHARFDWNEGLFSTGGKLSLCVALPGMVVVNGLAIPTEIKNYRVTMRTLAVDQGVFHIDSFALAN